jgi:hypothetical protein
MSDRPHADADRLDFSPLDPRADASGFEQLVRDVRRAAAPELVRRRASTTIWGQIATWRRPILVGSGALALVAALVVVVVRPAATPPATLEEALGVPGQIAPWVQATERPSPGELLGTEWSPR